MRFGGADLSAVLGDKAKRGFDAHIHERVHRAPDDGASFFIEGGDFIAELERYS